MNKQSVNRMSAASALLAALLALAGCAPAPAYVRPSALLPAAFKEASAQSGAQAATLSPDGVWKIAEPSEALARGAWWRVFGDTALDELEGQAADANQNLKAAAARVAEARAVNQSARAARLPSVGAGIGATRQKQSAAALGQPAGSDGAAQTLYRAQVDVSYEVDLFGRIAAGVDAAGAEAQRGEALFRSVQLALQADVAQHYFALRELDAEAEVLAQSVVLREQGLALLRLRYEEGAIAEFDVARARSELETARSEALGVQRLRAASEHALAILLGKAPAQFAMAPRPLQAVGLRLPAGLPSALLERRPDIAAAERAMAAANARVGAAKSAFFPSLVLTGSAGGEAASFGDLFKRGSSVFLLGPLAGTALNMPLFDGGRRKGELAQSRAQYEEAVALYRQQVLTALGEVEDGLSELRLLEQQTATQERAGAASARASALARTQYAEGAVNYLEVIDAERTALQTRRAEVRLQGSQAAAAVGLIRALGGGWGAP